MGYSPNGDEEEQQDESTSFFEGKRRSFLKMAGGGLGLSALGGAAISSVGAQTGDNCCQVDFIYFEEDAVPSWESGPGFKDPLDANGYSGEDRLIRWAWADDADNTAEEDEDRYDGDPFGDGNWNVSTTNGIEINGNVASVDFNVSGLSGDDEIHLALVAYTAPCGSSLGWDPSQAENQSIYTIASSIYNEDNDGGELSVLLPTADVNDGLQIYEPFDLEVQSHPEPTRTGALGVDTWSSPDSIDLDIINDQLGDQQLQLHRDGNVLEMGSTWVAGSLDEAIPEGTTWFSFLLEGGSQDEAVIAFPPGTGHGHFGQPTHIRFGVGPEVSDSNQDEWNVSIVDADVDYDDQAWEIVEEASTGVTYQQNESVFAVLKMDLDPDGVDEVGLWIDPDVTTGDPGSANASVDYDGSEDLGVPVIQFRRELLVDMIYAGNTYDDVTPENDPFA